MPAESAPQNPLGRIDPRMFAPTPEAVVTPNAVTALQEAVRRGQISANEVYDRMTMKPVVEAQVQNATDPQLVEARKQQELAASTQAQNQAAASTIALAQAKVTAQMPAQIREMQADLAKQGWSVNPVESETWTPEDSKEVVRRWGVSEEFKAKQGRVAAELSLVKPESVVTERGTEMVPFNQQTASPVDPGQVASAQQFITTFSRAKDWDKAGRPDAPSLFGAVAPGTSAPIGVAAAASGTAPGLRGTVIKPPGDGKAATEAQTKAANFVARSLTANEVFANLEKAGYNPGAVKNWAQELLVGPLKAFKSADKREFDAAKSSWAQGLLRLESGAAISAKEESWYLRTFFPEINDPPAVQNQKAQMRADVEKIADAVAKSGHLDVPQLLNIRERAEAIGGTGTAAGTPPASPFKQVTISGLGKVNIDMSSGSPRIVSQAPATSRYVPPATIGAKPKRQLVIEAAVDNASKQMRKERIDKRQVKVEPKD